MDGVAAILSQNVVTDAEFELTILGHTADTLQLYLISSVYGPDTGFISYWYQMDAVPELGTFFIFARVSAEFPV